ncbi:MAG: circularly permuted type 2 ATP-grasp protein [Akkermansiaceae bacterium]
MISQSQSQSSTIIQDNSVTNRKLFQKYVAGSVGYDECCDSSGELRPHWKEIAKHFDTIQTGAWDTRRAQLDKLIQDYGVTYDLYSEDSGDRGNWSLDMVPNCVDELEMNRIESMLSQRALLLNLTLQDIYGRQSLLKEGNIPPYLVMGNPEYLRPCHGLIGSKQKHIHVYAADIARSQNGDWLVMSDRLESAAGMGYSLEHRSLMSRVFPAMMTESGAKSLQPFINEFCRYVDTLAPRNVESPSIALLSSGPSHPNYFEQSFLARNLGFRLVEGADLTVRNNRLYMKTVSGVEAVDVLLRRVNSAWCDPLELHNHSLLGVPGLVNVIRQGNLTVANGLGCGVAESVAFPALLPRLSRKLLGEPLECPSIATWWCGQARELGYVLANLEKLVVRSTFETPQSPVYYGPNLTKKELSNLAKRIQHKPQGYCAQEAFSLATVPASQGRSLVPRNFMMRVIMIPTAGGWKIMPGGLTRYDDDHVTSSSLKNGGHSKDTWVIGDRGDEHRSTQAPVSASVLDSVKRHRRLRDDLPSRTADNLFWLGRYLERTESLARLLKTLSSLLISQASSVTLQTATPFITQLPESGDPGDFQLNPEAGILTLVETEQRMLQAIYNRSSGASLLSNLDHIERTASALKERLSSDTWLRLLSVCEAAKAEPVVDPNAYDDNVIHALESILHDLSGFIGTLMENMTRSLGWIYLQVGRRIERSLAIAQLLREAFASGQIEKEGLLEYLLVWADSSITYRRLYLNVMDPGNVLDVVCFDENNPRSLAYQATDIQELMLKLPHHQMNQRHPIDLCTLKLHSRIGLSDSEQLIQQYKTNPKLVVSFFDGFIHDLESLSTEFDKTYFAPTALAKESAMALSI